MSDSFWRNGCIKFGFLLSLILGIAGLSLGAEAAEEIAAASAKHPMIHHVMQSHSDKTSTMFHKKADADRHASSLRAQGHKPTVFSDNMHPNVIKKNASKIR